MKSIKRITALVLAAVLAVSGVSLASPDALAAQGVTRADRTVALPGGGSRSVTALEIDLSDPGIRIFSVHAEGAVGATASLKDIAAQLNGASYEVIAAINGTFFDAYVKGKQVAMGTVVSNGEMIHKYDKALIGFGLDNTVSIGQVKIRCIGWTGGVKDSAHSFYIHNWNRLLPASTSYNEAVLTPAFGARTGASDMNVLVVRDDVITAITKGDTAIPGDGFVYVYPDSSPYNDGRFKVGACFEYERTYYDWNDKAIDWSGMHNITGVGPTLVINGAKTADAAAEGWDDPKLTQGAGARSFIGYDESGKKLIMGTAASCTISQMGDLALAYGLKDAMNLDGGASSGLLLEGSYLTTPGRLLSNAIVVVRVKQTVMSQWARADIARGVSLRYIPADLQSAYTANITRAEYCRTLIQMLQRVTLMGKNELMAHFGVSAAKGRFPDVTSHQEAILTANALGIVNGGSDGNFNPGGSITRAEAAVMLANLAKRFNLPVPAVGGPTFADAGDIPSWAADSVSLVSALGLMQGGSDGRFNPGGQLTREQCFAVVLRLGKLIPQISVK